LQLEKILFYCKEKKKEPWLAQVNWLFIYLGNASFFETRIMGQTPFPTK
jgi:hypothetical protein